MDAREVIENIDSIYRRFRMPKHLQDHLRRAAAVGRFICEHWKGKEIDVDNVVAVLLLHDLGNVVRFDFDNVELNSLYEEDSDLGDLKRIKNEAIERYGEDDHVATDKMCRELEVNDRILFLLKNKTFVQNKDICAAGDFELKICAYADQRIGPRGVMGLEERLDKAKARGSKSMQHPEADLLVNCALKIEKQVLDNTDLSAEEISDEAIGEI